MDVFCGRLADISDVSLKRSGGAADTVQDEDATRDTFDNRQL